MWAGSWETVIILAKPVIARTPTLDRGIFDFPPWRLERVSGIEPPPSAWKAEVLPLNYTRLSYLPPPLNWWRGKDSNLRRHSQQIYSLPPLTAWVPLRGQEPAIVLRDSRGVNGFSASKRDSGGETATFSRSGGRSAVSRARTGRFCLTVAEISSERLGSRRRVARARRAAAGLSRRRRIGARARVERR